MDSTAIVIGVLSLAPFLVQRFTRKFIYFAVFALIAIVAHGLYLYGPHILYLLGVTYILSTAAELMSLKTPYNVFGVTYRYDTNHAFFASNIRLLGVYPIEISFAWVIFKYVSFNLAVIIVSAFAMPYWWEAVFIPLILVSVDFIIDPVAVHTVRLWHWERGSAYFGIPWQNFLGWYLVGLVTTLMFLWLSPVKTVRFDYLLILPVLFYASLLNNMPRLFSLDKQLSIVAITPLTAWTAVAAAGLWILSRG